MGSPEQEGCQLMDTKQTGQGTVAIGIQQKAKRAESTEGQKWQETTSVLTASTWVKGVEEIELDFPWRYGKRQ